MCFLRNPCVVHQTRGSKECRSQFFWGGSHPPFPTCARLKTHLEIVSNMVPRAGLEPARPFGLGILSPLCLPFHHRGIAFLLGVLRVTPRFRRAWIHFWQHLLLRETLRNETIETWTIHERLGGSQHADWLFIATGWRPLCAQFRATDQARRKSKGVMAGIGFMTIAAWGGHKYGGRLIGKVYTIWSALLLACMAALERYPTIQTLHLRGVALKRSVSSC